MFFKKKGIILIIAPLLTLFFDFILEPIAMFLDYWSWAGNYIPTKNYVAWYLIALIFTIVYVAMKCKTKNKLPAVVFVIQLMYFIFLRVILV